MFERGETIYDSKEVNYLILVSYHREFKDGLFSNIISNNENLSLWIVLNGDVDPCWAESLNSALDDNRILTLPNGVGIKLDSQTR